MNYIIYINVKKQHGKDGFINALAVLRDYIASLTKKINWSQYYWSKIGVVNQLHMGNLDVIRFVRLWVGKNSLWTHTPANISLFKVNKRYTRKNCEICLKLITKTPEWRHWRPNKRGDGGLKNVLGQKWQLVIANYGCPKQNVFAPYLNIQSRNIQRYVFETSLI